MMQSLGTALQIKVSEEAFEMLKQSSSSKSTNLSDIELELDEFTDNIEQRFDFRSIAYTKK